MEAMFAHVVRKLEHRLDPGGFMHAILLDIVFDVYRLNLQSGDPIEVLASDTVILTDKKAPYTAQTWRLQVFDDISEP